jgi:hypothetical protein
LAEEIALHGVIDLTPRQALDEAERFAHGIGYETTHRGEGKLTLQRPRSGPPGSKSPAPLVISVDGQRTGGVKVKLTSNDGDEVRRRKNDWFSWSDALPRKSQAS